MKRFFSFLILACLLAGCADPAAAVPQQPGAGASSSAPAAPSENEPQAPAADASEASMPGESLGAPSLAGGGSAKDGSCQAQGPFVPIEQYTAQTLQQETLMSADPAVQSWPAAYESFYSAYGRVKGMAFTSDEAELRDQFVYPLYTIYPEALRDAWRSLSGPLSAKAVEGLMGEADPDEVGLLLNKKGSDDFYGEGRAEIRADQNLLSMQSLGEWKTGYYANRTSLTMTAGLEAQLLALGYSPETTKAYALSIEGYTHGVAFLDGDKACFYNNNDGPPANGYISAGVVYTFDQLAGDIEERWDDLFPPESETGSSKDENPVTAKPVIYLYPDGPADVSVTLGYPEENLTYAYPAYDGGWRVTAYPDGRLVNRSDGSEHFYLFWEGNKRIDWDFSEGFVVRGSEAEDFLREKLSFLGLTPREYNDFIVYWAPELAQNEYNLITFSGEQYEELAPLTVVPKPDSVLRVHMVYKAVGEPVEIPEQELVPFSRSGFTVIEWGGTRA